MSIILKQSQIYQYMLYTTFVHLEIRKIQPTVLNVIVQIYVFQTVYV